PERRRVEPGARHPPPRAPRGDRARSTAGVEAPLSPPRGAPARGAARLVVDGALRRPHALGTAAHAECLRAGARRAEPRRLDRSGARALALTGPRRPCAAALRAGGALARRGSRAPGARLGGLPSAAAGPPARRDRLAGQR